VAQAGEHGPLSRRAAPLAVGALAAVLALAVAGDAGVKGFGALPEALRATAALLALVCVAGYAPARLLVPRSMERDTALLVPLVGCATAGLGLTALGFLRIPWPASLALLLAAGAGAGIAVRMRMGPARVSLRGAAWPAYLVVLLTMLALVPVFRDDLATVYGFNPDGHLSVGAAEFLQHSRPESIDASLPVDRMPLVWRSKYPIYYVLAGASSLSGLDPIEAFAAVSALLAAFTALGFMLLARHTLRAPPGAALLAMGLVGLDRLVAHLALHPYHNQLWGTLALPLMLMFGWRLLEEPDRRTGVLFALFLVLGLLAYPLMVVFPLLALGAGALARARRDGFSPPRPRAPATTRGRALAALAVIVAVPAALVLLRGVYEKSSSAADVLLPGRSLAAWRGDLRAFPQLGFFFGAPGKAVGPSGIGEAPAWLGGALALAAVGAAIASLRALPRDVAAGIGAVIAGGLALTLYFRLRTGGEYFYFKLLAFLAPLVVACAAVGLARAWAGARRPLALGAAALVAIWTGLAVLGLRQEVRNTGPQLTPGLLALRDAANTLPAGSSVRLDLPTDGSQLWAGYMLAAHPLSSQTPLVGTTYPHVPPGRKADFILAPSHPRGGLSRDATGPPVATVPGYRLYRMKRTVPGPDVSSKRMQEGLGQNLE
jgi:hypothetical protein